MFGLSDDEDEDGSDFYSMADSGRRCTIYLIDGSKKMFEKLAKSDEAGYDCAFRRALKIVRQQMVNKAVTTTSLSNVEYTSCVFMNTLNKSSADDCIFVWQAVDMLSAERVKQVDSLYKTDNIHEAFTDICGGHGKCDYSQLLFLCIKKLTTNNPSFQKRTVYLFTNDDNPFGLSKHHLIGASRNASDLRNHAAEFAVVPLIEEAEEGCFDFSIWKQVDPDISRNYENIQDLEEDDIPRKQSARRNISKITLDLGDGVLISVGVYALIRPIKKPQAISLDAEGNAVLQKSFRYFNKETKETALVVDEEISCRKSIGGAQVAMSRAEVEKLRRITLPGLTVLGFKSVDRLKIGHHMRSSLFLYPLESEIVGSSRLYRSLYEVCLAEQKMIICRYTQKQNVLPRLVALIPQSGASEQEISKAANKFLYAGFHLVHLPFYENLRDLRDRMTASEASTEQVDAARAFIKRLTGPYHAEKFCNPVLQKHFKVMEALSLDYDEVAEVKDQIEPYFKNETFLKRVFTELGQFRSAVVSEEYTAEPQKTSTKGRKVKAVDATEPSRKLKKPNADDLFLEQLANESRLNSLTVSVLRAKAFEAGICVKSTMNKAQLIELIEGHFGIG
ncbi:hypothetical protein AB6A40_001454 [Gnathostoma spinigerum]|uniref:Ku domain-containing protein n=1 Tax=Gnathostoma spinigerum TaxID=75299 RepID=A0ABD6EEI8_9BILA